MLFLTDKPYPIPAAQVHVGDDVKTMEGPHTVTHITKIIRNGFYNPLTIDGTIVVNGIITSSFSSLDDNEFVETSCALNRWHYHSLAVLDIPRIVRFDWRYA